MTRIYVVRHAQAEGNLYRRAHGRYNSMITAQGYVQIAALKERFAQIPVDAVYSSPRRRTCMTAAAVYEPKGLPLQVLEELREVDCGPWENRTWGDIRYADGEQLDNFLHHIERWHLAGAESLVHVRERMLRVLDRVVNECPGQTAVIVTHGMASRILLGTLKGLSLEEINDQFPHGGNTAVSLIEYENGQYRVAFANDMSHLDQYVPADAKRNWRWGERSPDIGLRFVPLNVESDVGAALYQLCRAEGWLSSHGNMAHYDGEAFLEQARRNQRAYSEAVLMAYHVDTFAGLLQLDVETESAAGVGRVPFVYMAPAYRKRGVGIQLIGEAVSRYRNMGRRRLRLRCAAENAVAQNFYRRCGFQKVEVDETAPVALDVLELDVSIL